MYKRQGLLKALGATARTIRLAFLAEAAMLSTVGAIVGYLLGQLGAFGLRQAFPVFPAYPPAVSYTHLDVYKRQAFHLRSAAPALPRR